MTDPELCRPAPDRGSSTSGSGRPLETRMIQGRPAEAWLCPDAASEPWDDFLRRSGRGQFQQSSLWARAKLREGWHTHRVILEQGGRVEGGFQLLWRSTRFGRMGYVSKGPVLSVEEAEPVDFVLALLLRAFRSQRLRAVIVQPPDQSQLLRDCLPERGFARDHLMNVISATCMVDLTGPPGEWEAHLGRSKKLQIRQARRRGVTVREGDEAEVPKFFDLMRATCARQGVHPNPATVGGLHDLVRAFKPRGEVRLSFADYQGESIAGVLDLRFGRRVTTWKKGWTGSQPHLHPNTLLIYESLRWAQGRGCEHFDFAGMNRSLAECLLAQRPLTETQKAHRDTFNLEFGAQPRLLPEAVVYWRHPLVRAFYAKAIAWPWARRRVARLASRLGS